MRLPTASSNYILHFHNIRCTDCVFLQLMLKFRDAKHYSVSLKRNSRFLKSYSRSIHNSLKNMNYIKNRENIYVKVCEIYFTEIAWGLNLIFINNQVLVTCLELHVEQDEERLCPISECISSLKTHKCLSMGRR